MNFQPRTADSGGDLATSATHSAGPLPFWRPPRYAQPSASGRRGDPDSSGWVRAALLAVLVSIFAGCGVQAPPRPPRVEIPLQIKDLSATQVGPTIQVAFTLPTLATDGERLTKPVQIDIFRALTPAGQKPASPGTNAAPWQSLLPRELSRYEHAGKLEYPFQISPQEFHQQQGSTFSFAVIALTRGFMGHTRKSAPSNVARATLLDVTEPVTNFAVKASQTALLLTWDKPVRTLAGLPPSHLSGYRIYQSATGKPDSFQLLGETASTHFDDKSFHFGLQYYFRVSAVTTLDGTVAESEPSAPIAIKPRDIFPPAAPTGLTAVNAAGAVDLLWNANTERDLAGYNVYRSTDGGPFERVNRHRVPTPIFHDTSVVPGHHYEYAITAVDLDGNESARSKPAGVTTPPPHAP